jgi:hypothetical protein
MPTLHRGKIPCNKASSNYILQQSTQCVTCRVKGWADPCTGTQAKTSEFAAPANSAYQITWACITGTHTTLELEALANSTRLIFALPIDGWFHKHSNHQDRFSTVSVQARTWRFFSLHDWLVTTIAQWEFWLVPWHQFHNLEGMHGMSLPTESETEQNKLPLEEMTTVLGDIRINLLSTPWEWPPFL